ncbi:hypothetical protein D3C85_1389130 [compost metagenome]
MNSTANQGCNIDKGSKRHKKGDYQPNSISRNHAPSGEKRSNPNDKNSPLSAFTELKIIDAQDLHERMAATKKLIKFNANSEPLYEAPH